MRCVSLLAVFVIGGCHHNRYPDCSPQPTNGAAVAWQREPGDAIAGRVVDIDGKGIPQATVFLAGTSHARHSDDAGRFRFGSVRPGAYVVGIRRIGYERLDHRVMVEPGYGAVLTAVLEPQVLRLTDECGFGFAVARPWWKLW